MVRGAAPGGSARRARAGTRLGSAFHKRSGAAGACACRDQSGSYDTPAGDPGSCSASSCSASSGCSRTAAAPAPTAPFVQAFSNINSGDTAWMMTSTALVLMMTIPGLGLFYAGMVRKKNILATLMQSFAITCLVTVLWWLVGYSLAFTPGTTKYIGSLHWAFMNPVVYMHDAMKESSSHLATTIPRPST